MKVRLLVVGKTHENYLKEGISVYEERLKHYCDWSFEIIPDVKNLKGKAGEAIKDMEADLIEKRLSPNDFLILLDENGKMKSSEELAEFLQQLGVRGTNSIVFLVGGAFGVSERIKKQANLVLSLSKMTFSHQMVRLFAVEQIYRAFTIIRNEGYHHR